MANDLQMILRNFAKKWQHSPRGNSPTTSAGREAFSVSRPRGDVMGENLRYQGPGQNIDFTEILRNQVPQQAEEQGSFGSALGNALGGGAATLLGKQGTASSTMPQTNAELIDRRAGMVEKNPLAGIGDTLTRMLGGENGRDLERTNPYGGRVVEEGNTGFSADAETEQAERAGLLPKEGQRKRESDITRAEIERREGKDFSKGGKDYDKDHDWKDVMRALGIGALQGFANTDPRQSLGAMIGSGLGGGIAGGVAGVFDRNTDEKMGNEISLAREYDKYKRQFEREQSAIDADQKNRKAEADIRGAEMRPDIALAEVERKRIQGDRNLELKERTQNWKEADRVEYYRLEREKQAALAAKDDRAYELAVRRQTEIERNNKARDPIALENVRAENQRKLQAIKEKGMAARQAFNDAAKRGQMAEAAKHKADYERLKAEFERENAQ